MNPYPGFIDNHSHGAIGIDVNTATAEELCRISLFFQSHGVAGWLPTILTDSEEATLQAIRHILEAQKSGQGARILGIHLEGPFLNPKYAGAMPQDLLRKGDCFFVERCLKESRGQLKLMTLAPEIEGNLEVIKEFSRDIAISLGHSDATYDVAMEAVDRGARCITHCGNAMRLFHQHEPGLLGAALDSDVYLETICDGRHLAPSTVHLYMKLKGPERIIAITDSISATGMPDGDYMLGVNPITVKDGDAMLRGQNVRAGSTLTMDRAYENLARFTGRDRSDLVRCVRDNALELIGCPLPPLPDGTNP